MRLFRFGARAPPVHDYCAPRRNGECVLCSNARTHDVSVPPRSPRRPQTQPDPILWRFCATASGGRDLHTARLFIDYRIRSRSKFIRGLDGHRDAVSRVTHRQKRDEISRIAWRRITYSAERRERPAKRGDTVGETDAITITLSARQINMQNLHQGKVFICASNLFAIPCTRHPPPIRTIRGPNWTLMTLALCAGKLCRDAR